ncbi:MAG TPA: hypothetical protein DCL80_10305, partial [Balneola sp.]|nr:hypothetical protein [Balneola sp.]
MIQNGKFIILEHRRKILYRLLSALKRMKIRYFLLSCIALIVAESKSAHAQDHNSLALEEIFSSADDISTVRTLLIQQNRTLLGARSFDGRILERPYNIKSASKSIIGLLTGIAIEKGFIPSIQEPIKTYFPEYFEENPDSLKESITIRNLLTMQTGLRSTSSGNYGAWVISDNWVEYALDQDFVSKIDGR